MNPPSQYLRQLREGATRRRLELAKMLRDDPSATNKALAKALNVTRDTIALATFRRKNALSNVGPVT